MEIPFFLAMTCLEQRMTPSLPPHIAHMSCHFSPDSSGITDIPASLPTNSILILDDSVPMTQRKISMLVSRLSDAARQLHCQALLLDFQRGDDPGYPELANALIHKMPCPVGISEAHAAGLDCAVFLSPPPLCRLPDETAAPWKGRELWLDATCSRAVYTVTEHGCSHSVSRYSPDKLPHRDSRLCCHYRTTVEPDKIRFTLSRGPEDLLSLIHALTPLGLTCAIGLYQEFGDGFPP